MSIDVLSWVHVISRLCPSVLLKRQLHVVEGHRVGKLPICRGGCRTLSSAFLALKRREKQDALQVFSEDKSHASLDRASTSYSSGVSLSRPSRASDKEVILSVLSFILVADHRPLSTNAFSDLLYPFE